MATYLYLQIQWQMVNGRHLRTHRKHDVEHDACDALLLEVRNLGGAHRNVLHGGEAGASSRVSAAFCLYLQLGVRWLQARAAHTQATLRNQRPTSSQFWLRSPRPPAGTSDTSNSRYQQLPGAWGSYVFLLHSSTTRPRK